MKFINRQNELKELEDCYAFSKKRLFSVMIYGMRRVGKTELRLLFSFSPFICFIVMLKVKEKHQFIFFKNPICKDK